MNVLQDWDEGKSDGGKEVREDEGIEDIRAWSVDIDESSQHQASQSHLFCPHLQRHKTQTSQPSRVSATMKFNTSSIVLSIFAATALATPADFTRIGSSPRDLAAQVSGCGAAGSCAGPGGGDLCNDRVSYRFLRMEMFFVLMCECDSASGALERRDRIVRASAVDGCGCKFKPLDVRLRGMGLTYLVCRSCCCYYE